jgi:hypothetical protein
MLVNDRWLLILAVLLVMLPLMGCSIKRTEVDEMDYYPPHADVEQYSNGGYYPYPILHGGQYVDPWRVRSHYDGHRWEYGTTADSPGYRPKKEAPENRMSRSAEKPERIKQAPSHKKTTKNRAKEVRDRAFRRSNKSEDEEEEEKSRREKLRKAIRNRRG